MPLDVLDRATLLGQSTYFVLTLTYAGREYHLSTGTFEISTNAGDSIQVLDAIDEIDWEQALDLFSDSLQAISVPFEIVVPNVDFAELISQGYDLSAATGELSRWVTGTTWENRQIVLVGHVEEPSYGAQNEPVAFSLSQAPFDDRSSMIDPDAVVDDISWPNADDEALGNTYPVVFGAPGYWADGASNMPATPGHIVDTTVSAVKLLIAGHHVNASTVSVKNMDNGTDFASRNVTNSTDGRGRQVAYATLTDGAGDGQYNSTTAGNEYMVAWPADGAMYNRRRDGTLQYAGDILATFLDQTTMTYDRGRTVAAANKLNAWKLAGYADEEVSYWDWIKDNVLPILPVSMVVGPSGAYPVVWPYEATTQDAIEWIDVQRLDGERTSEVQYNGIDTVANNIVVAYGLNLKAGQHRRRLRITGNDDLRSTYDRNLYSNALTRVSRSRYGPSTLKVECDICYDRVTAAKIANWLSYAHAATTRTVSYQLPVHYRFLELGDVVVVTDSEISWTDQLCWVEAIMDADVGQIEVTFRTIEAPGQTGVQ